MIRPAVFLDRDGVIIRDVHLLTRCEQVEIYDFASQAVRQLKDAGFVVVVVSNQSVVARGLASEKDVELVNARIQQLLGGEGIDRFYFCPHHPNATLPQYRAVCSCRKPNPGMLLRAAQELDLDLKSSYMVGDRLSDVLAGQRAGCKTILVNNSKQFVEPDYVCADLGKAVGVILEKTI